METWDTIRARRNVRQYTDEPIVRENLELKRPGFDAPFVTCERPAGRHDCERSGRLRLRQVAVGRGGA